MFGRSGHRWMGVALGLAVGLGNAPVSAEIVFFDDAPKYDAAVGPMLGQTELESNGGFFESNIGGIRQADGNEYAAFTFGTSNLSGGSEVAGGVAAIIHIDDTAVNDALGHSLEDGDVLRMSMWFANDPGNPLGPISTALQKIEFSDVELYQGGPTDQLLLDTERTGTPSQFTDVKPVELLSDTAWEQFVFEYEVDASQFTGSGMGGIASLEEIRPVFFIGQFGAGEPEGTILMDRFRVEVFDDQAAADASPVDMTNPGAFREGPHFTNCTSASTCSVWDGDFMGDQVNDFNMAGDGVSWSDELNWTIGDPSTGQDLGPPSAGDFVVFTDIGTQTLTIDIGGSAPVVEAFQAYGSHNFTSSDGDKFTIQTGVIRIANERVIGFDPTVELVSGTGTIIKEDFGILAIDGTAPAVVVDAGTVGGSGTLASLDVEQDGTVSPGNSVGTFNVTGAATIAGRLFAEVDTAADLLSVGGAVDLLAVSRLEVVPLEGFVAPASGSTETHTIISGTSVTGTFRAPTLEERHLGDGAFADAVYNTGNTVDLEIHQAVPGDANGDRTVAASSDGATLLANLGGEQGSKTWIDADFNGDGNVTASADGAALLGGLGTDGANAVPEPSSLWLLAMTLLGVPALRSWRRR